MIAIECTAASLRAVLAFCDPKQTPKIAYDRDDLAQPLINHIKKAVGDYDGSRVVLITFDDRELAHQFKGVVLNIADVMVHLSTYL